MSDTITMPRAVVQQALSDICAARLCEVNSMSSRQEMLRLMIRATDNLRAALAQQAEPVACNEQITVEELAAALGWPGGISTPLQGKVELLRIVAHARVAQQAIPVLNGMERAFSSEAMGRRDERQGLPASQQQAEPVQAVSGVVIREGLPTLLRDRDIQTTDTRLYTTPQQRKPLTDDEIEALFKGVDSEDKGRFAIVRGFARAIEAAHGIKEAK